MSINKLSSICEFVNCCCCCCKFGALCTTHTQPDAFTIHSAWQRKTAYSIKWTTDWVWTAYYIHYAHRWFGGPIHWRVEFWERKIFDFFSFYFLVAKLAYKDRDEFVVTKKEKLKLINDMINVLISRIIQQQQQQQSKMKKKCVRVAVFEYCYSYCLMHFCHTVAHMRLYIKLSISFSDFFCSLSSCGFLVHFCLTELWSCFSFSFQLDIYQMCAVLILYFIAFIFSPFSFSPFNNLNPPDMYVVHKKFEIKPNEKLWMMERNLNWIE